MKRVVKVVLGSQSEIEELQSDHEEADSRLFLHIAHAKQVLGVDRVLLWSIDSDVGQCVQDFAYYWISKNLILKPVLEKQKGTFLSMK